MIRQLQYIILLSALLVLSCDEKFVIINCNDCTFEEPVSSDIEMILDPKAGTFAIVNIYEGNIEDGILVKTQNTPTSSSAYVNLKLNRKYTFAAYYYDQAGNEFVVVDSVYPRVKYDASQCQEPCYYVYDKTVKLKLAHKGRFRFKQENW